MKSVAEEEQAGRHDWRVDNDNDGYTNMPNQLSKINTLIINDYKNYISIKTSVLWSLKMIFDTLKITLKSITEKWYSYMHFVVKFVQSARQ